MSVKEVDKSVPGLFGGPAHVEVHALVRGCVPRREEVRRRMLIENCCIWDWVGIDDDRCWNERWLRLVCYILWIQYKLINICRLQSCMQL